MLHVTLWEPEIPPNAGNVVRLCAATGVRLHLVGRLGFRLDDRRLRRAGLDYWDDVDVSVHAGWDEFLDAAQPARLIALSANVTRPYTDIRYAAGDCLVFGSESKGLPASLLGRYSESAVTVPMPAGKVRSLNLATTVGIVLYEALRQLHAW